ncbi:MAG: HAMP domain-containing sensor histidine kinase, partial [Acidobacteriota bacterium]
ITLAVLQYRWIAQVSEADAGRLQAALRASITRFTEDFNGELERLTQIVVGGSSSETRLDAAVVESRVELWRGASQHPQILKQVWMADAADLPEYLKKLAARVSETGGRQGRGPRPPIVIDSTVPALAIPHIRPQPGTDLPGEYLILELNRDYIRGTWIPELAARDFGANFNLEIRGDAGENGIIYRTAGETPIGAAEQGGTGTLLSLRITPFARGGRGGGPGGGGPDGGKGGPDRFRGGDKGTAPNNDKGGPDFGKRGFGGGLGGDPGWRVLASYKSGSMAELVEFYRLRNLAVSFGILLLMGVSVAMLMWSSQRATGLAQQQMEFVAGVTHELRTPLAVILSASQNLADGVTSGEQQTRRYGGVIRDQSRRLSGMVEQVLRFAGLSSQHGELQRGPVDVAELIEGSILDSDPEIAAGGAEVQVDIAENLPAIDGDGAALAHCLRNLLGNAAKHGGGAAVRVLAKDANGRVEICVEDSGPGIDAADLPHIFEPFYRGKRARDEQVQGSGLGLSLVKKIVEAHGGSVDVTSRPGHGTSFRVLLPAART